MGKKQIETTWDLQQMKSNNYHRMCNYVLGHFAVWMYGKISVGKWY